MVKLSEKVKATHVVRGYECSSMWQRSWPQLFGDIWLSLQRRIAPYIFLAKGSMLGLSNCLTTRVSSEFAVCRPRFGTERADIARAAVWALAESSKPKAHTYATEADFAECESTTPRGIWRPHHTCGFPDSSLCQCIDCIRCVGVLQRRQDWEKDDASIATLKLAVLTLKQQKEWWSTL